MSNAQKTENKQPTEVSKTAIKKEMLALHQLGKKIVALPKSQLDLIPLEEKLLDAIVAARKITKHGGLKRQLQYIGKLLRHVDTTPIQKAFDEIESGNQKNTELLHMKEIWREQLIVGGKEKITEFLLSYPKTDRQRLQQLLRNYKNANGEEKKKILARRVYKIISEQLEFTD